MARIRKTSDIGCIPTSELQKLDQNLREQHPNFPRSGFASTKTLIASSSCSSDCLGVHLFPWHQVTNSPWSFWSILVHTSSSYRTKATKRVETTPVYHRSTRSTSLNMILRSRRQICRARVYLYGIGFLVCWYGIYCYLVIYSSLIARWVRSRVSTSEFLKPLWYRFVLKWMINLYEYNGKRIPSHEPLTTVQVVTSYLI